MIVKTPFSPLDFAVIAVYFAVVLGAGLFMGKYVKSTSDFFSGGKRVPWWTSHKSGGVFCFWESRSERASGSGVLIETC